MTTTPNIWNRNYPERRWAKRLAVIPLALLVLLYLASVALAIAVERDAGRVLLVTGWYLVFAAVLGLVYLAVVLLGAGSGRSSPPGAPRGRTRDRSRGGDARAPA
jgi:hypothetical protein